MAEAGRHFPPSSRQIFLPPFLLVLMLLIQSLTFGPIHPQNLPQITDEIMVDDPIIPSYDSDGDGVSDANDSHPTNPVLSLQLIGGAELSEWSSEPLIAIDIGKQTTNENEIPEAMEWGDIDNDGDLDMFLSRYQGPNEVWMNDGNGYLTRQAWNQPNDDTKHSVLVDMNNDGWIDVLSANYQYPNTLYYNNNGTFNNSPDWTTWPYEGISHGLSVGDVNGDGDLDVHFSRKYDIVLEGINGNISNNSLWTEPSLSIDDGEFGNSTGYSITFLSSLADIDRDGDLDIIQQNSRGTTLDFEIQAYDLIWLNDGNGNFGIQNAPAADQPNWASWHAHVGEDVELADLDGDGYLEIIYSYFFHPTTVSGVFDLTPNAYFHNNNGSFTKNATWTSNPARFTSAVASGDLDFDGDIDLVFGNGGLPYRNNSNPVFENQNGTFSPDPTWESDNKSTMDVQVIDYDGDKDLDIAFIRRNDTNGPFYLELFENPWSNIDKDNYGDDEDDCPALAGNSTEDRTGCPDTDGDGWSDADTSWTWGMGADRFPNNADQHSDSDGDGYGDNPNGTDGDDCPQVWGGSSEGDILGCLDSDNDGWADSIDWSASDQTQWADDDNDNYGDNPNGTDGDDCPSEWGNSTENGTLGCTDIDGDGWADSIDWSVNDSSQWIDDDGDSYGDNTSGTNGDDCPSEWGNSTENGTLGCTDIDGDGWADTIDWSVNDSSQWIDGDGDDWGDNPNGTDGDDCPNEWGNSTENGTLGCIDFDGDGWADIIDSHENESSQWLDGDNDGYGDNPDGLNADDCPLQFGESYTDLLGCADWDNDGMSNDNDPDPLDATLTLDPDDDNVDSSIDNCPDNSNSNQSDYDNDEFGDVCDDDSDGDTIPDLLDACPMGNNDWNSTSDLDIDGDGCKDLTEDSDDDGDGVLDGEDLCANTALTYTGWVSTNGSGDSANSTDWDGDGCEDDSGEDLDDDNDGVVDVIDVCPNSPFGWISTETTDIDSNGCEDISQDTDGDGTPDKFDQCPNTAANITVDDKGCSVSQQSQISSVPTASTDGDDLSFVEKLVTGDLDAIGLVMALLLPVVGIILTIVFQYRKKAYFRGLRKRILIAETEDELLDVKPLLVKSISAEQISQGQYNILLEAIEENLIQFSRQEETVEKGEMARSKTKEKWNETFSTKTDDESYSVDEDGIEWREDENEQWWYRNPGEEEWGKWED